ncbi:MAG: glycosyltransferase [Comamonadaceae bacterium]|nr:glycosyltransferase [Rhodoferax sp.]TSA10741.1 MAG: glycosyltransferase [Comamonadaceae bacterium]
MRILIILHQFYPEFSGGTERVALNLARSAQRAGHYVRILACAVTPDAAGVSCNEYLAGAHDSVYQGVPLTLLPREILPASADFSLEIESSLIEPMVGWMKQERFELAHVMHTMRMSTAVLAAQRCGLPLILTLTDFFLACPRINLVNLDNQVCDGPQLGKKCGERCLTAPWSRDSLASRYQHAAELLASASVRVTPSEFVANRFRAAFAALDFRVVPHGIDLLALANQKAIEGRQLENEFRVRLVYVGGIIPQKGLDLLLRALALVKASNIELKIIGGFHGAAAYHSEVLALGKADARVEFLGHLEPGKVFEAIAQADLLCLPSRVPETFSLALHEAAALGVPALVSDLGAPGEQVSRNGAGLALACEDVKAWAKAIGSVAAEPEQIKGWQARLPLPLRVEEEAFYYDSLYRTLLSPA